MQTEINNLEFASGNAAVDGSLVAFTEAGLSQKSFSDEESNVAICKTSSSASPSPFRSCLLEQIHLPNMIL